VSSTKIPDEADNFASRSDTPIEPGAPRGEGPPDTEELDTTRIADEARGSTAKTSAESELDPTSQDEELLRYLFTIC
jgi:hypothetical protein